MKKLLILPLLAILVLMGNGCNDADVASQNLSNEANNFQINRRIVFYNGITGDYMLTIEGLCSLRNDDPADNVTYFAEQIDSVTTDIYHYQVTFKPSVIIPDIQIK